jgi:hypothetical protein
VITTAEALPTSHYLLPHERWQATKELVGQRAHPTAPEVVRLQQNYGPEGNVLLAAARAGRIYAFPLVLAGGILVFLTAGNGPVALVGYLVLAIAIAMGSLGFARSVQAGQAGKLHRSGRPFVRRI